MTDETTSEQLAEIDGQVEYMPREGWRVVQFGEPLRGGDEYDSGLNRYIRRIEPEPQLEPETTTEQLVGIEGQGESAPATEYTPPEGWRVLQVGERLQFGDMTVRKDGYCYSTERVGYFVGANQRYIRPIEPQPQPQPEPQPVQVREGRWRTRGGDIRNVTPTPECDGRALQYPWWDAQSKQVWTPGGKYYTHISCGLDLVEYLGPIEPQPEPQEQPESDAELRIRLLKQANDSQAETIGRLLTEARDLNMEIGALERRLSERDARIRDLETMHAAATQAVVDAGKVNDSLRLQLAAVKAELANVAADRQRLQIELDAAQQVPADSPELRQLRADLAEVTLDRDQYKDAYTRLSAFVETVRETAKAEAVETIAEWTEPFRRCGSERLAWMVMQNLPHIMRSLTGLTPED